MFSQSEKLRELLGAIGESPRAELIQSFSELALDKASPEFLKDFDTAQLLAMVEGAVAFVEHRRPQEVLVRVYNPTIREHGWSASYSVLELALGDRPFIYDSVRNALRGLGRQIQHVLHPILGIRRDGEGRIAGERFHRPQTGSAEAYEIFLFQQSEPALLSKIEAKVRAVLADVARATDDFVAMREKAIEVAAGLQKLAASASCLPTKETDAELEEYRDFLKWLCDGNFVFLGYRVYDIQEVDGKPCLAVDRNSGLGILRDPKGSKYFEPVPLSEVPEGSRQRLTAGPGLRITKSNAEATVHHPARMDQIKIQKYDSQFRPAGEIRILGLFTSKAQSSPVDQIPIVRRKLQQVLSFDETIPGSHDYRQMVSIFNTMPLQELFWTPVEELVGDIRTIISLEQKHELRVILRPDPMYGGLAVTVILPRDRFNTEVRRRIQDFLTQRLKATRVDYHLAMGQDEAQARIHFLLRTSMPYESLDIPAIDREVAELSRSWDDRLFEALAERYGTQRAQELATQYQAAFSEVYKTEVKPSEAIRDIDQLEALGDELYSIDVDNLPLGRRSQAATHIKLYHRRKTFILSEVVPVFEHLGLRVLEQISYPLREEKPLDERRGIDVFCVVDREGKQLPVAEIRGRLVEALLKLAFRQVENDRLNQLVLTAGLTIRQVSLLRVYRQYLAQLQAATSRSFINETLISFPRSAELIYRYFAVKFNPAQEGKRHPVLEAIQRKFLESLNDVTSLPADRTLRALFQLVTATVRTNFFENRPYLSLKVRSADVEGMPEPRPYMEIVVGSPEMEGIHLRGGKVARGGLRWSDRPDDFRTEVLGLMKTQMTKNAVIVPVGSKGGFVLKHPPADRDALREAVQTQYRTFIRGLLDLTDNVSEGETIHPRGLVIYDEPDPYLVVAADKGTATFSDVANQISQEYNFWLADAFASGGSYGYDHKKEGITARGGWECVARHFREMGIDVSRDAFTAVGIGDMAGDVFGNGMLYTDKIRLLAAFNHMHIFIDPEPDAGRSFQERKRLFELPRSSWDDYDRNLISAGGGVFLRSSKAVPLSPEIRRIIGVDAEVLSGEDMVRAILKMPVDLLWNGGIGTYVKSTAERHAEVGDSSNDAVRINSDEVRARVIGEGGNLGLTQLARIEYSLLGGRMNTDAIDNSAGVDMSDHEVNIKILLQPVVRSGELTFEQRNDLLRSMTDEVSKLVLRDNYGQSLCLSLDHRQSRAELRPFQSLMEHLAERGKLKASVEFLPTRKIFEERSRNRVGLARPELAILLAYSKMGLQEELLESDLPDQPELRKFLLAYFPAQLRDRFPEAILEHPLRREIVACQVTSRIVDRLGITFVHGLEVDTGARQLEVVGATLTALEILSLDPLWERIFGLDNQVPTEIQYQALEEIRKAVRGVVLWLILSQPREAGVAGSEILPGLWRDVQSFLAPAERKRFLERARSLKEQGLVADLAATLAGLDYVPSLMGVLEASRSTAAPPEEVARAFYQLGERLSLGWLRDEISRMPKSNRWENIAAGVVVAELRLLQSRLTVDLVRAVKAGSPKEIELFLSERPAALERFDKALERMKTHEEEWGLVAAAVLTRFLRQMVEYVSH